MIRFNNDYNHGALDSILSALTATNTDSFAGYGEDIWCQRAETVIKQLVSREDALIKFVPGATQANLVVIAAALSPIQSVIAADTGGRAFSPPRADISTATKPLPSKTRGTKFSPFPTPTGKSPPDRSPHVRRRIMTAARRNT